MPRTRPTAVGVSVMSVKVEGCGVVLGVAALGPVVEAR